ncbi:MAG TPA: hypothetical protein VG754_00675 [Verrucomicrobiae bacterium]|nr:hypothetical protein [Verrucomicrobiae bacterium]
MSNILPPVGTNLLLESVCGYVPDDFIASLCARDFTGGRRHALSAPQLWRVHLLALLTPTHSLNLVVAQLSEQPGWRRFARLRRVYPTARMLHEFRQQVGIDGLRAINRHLLERLLRRQGLQPQAVALMDATDLPAACSGFKKKFRALHGNTCRTWRTYAQDRPKPLVCKLQEAHVAAVVADIPSFGDSGAAGQLGYPSQCIRRRPAGAKFALVSPEFGLVAGHCGGGHGLPVSRQQAASAGRLADSGGDQTAF